MTRLSFWLSATAALLCGIGQASAQEPGASAPVTWIAIVNLSPPAYPPSARQARIVGDVKIQLEVRQDGTIASAEVVSGHPMLKQAALESAQKSQFECRGYAAELTRYLVTYSFEIAGDCHFGPHCEQLDEVQPRITQARDQIRLTVGPACLCDPAAEFERVRSAKCLYLWKCGRH